MKRNWSWRWRRKGQDWLTRDLDGAETTVRIARALAARLPKQEFSLISALLSYGERLAEAARPEEAVAAAAEAVLIARRRAVAEPSRFEPNLAIGLHRQALWLAELRRTDEALVAMEEAAVIYRRLVPRDPIRFEPPLASALDTLRTWQS